MIAVMKREYTKEQIDAVVKIIEAGEAKPMISVGEGTTIIGVVGINHQVLPEDIAICPGVERVIPISAPYKLASRTLHPADTVITIRPEKGILLLLAEGQLL